MTTLVPDGTRTCAVLGDTHVGAITPRRLAKSLYGWNLPTPMLPDVALLAHVGDMTEGQKSGKAKGSVLPTFAQQAAASKAWWDGFTGATVKKATPGNHDLDQNDAGTGTAAAWGTAFGEAAGAVIETDHFVFITTTDNGSSQPLNTSGAQTAFENAVIAAAPKPVVLLHHFAMRNSHGPTNRFGVHGGDPSDPGNDTRSPNFDGTVSTTTDIFIRACAARQDNFVATVHGHTHPTYDTVAIAAGIDLASGRKLWTFNVGALTYVAGNQYGHAGWNPLTATLLTFYDDYLELRVRDIGAGVYLARDGRNRVERFDYA